MWDEEIVFDDGDLFFNQLEQEISQSKSTVDLETYIFGNDAIGHRIANVLCNAAQRGVAVRVMVDGIGSSGWTKTYAEKLEKAGVKYRVYHELPWEEFWQRKNEVISRFFSMIKVINRRNHRKVCIIDNASAFLGSMNISATHSRSIEGPAAWHDIGVKVSGVSVKDLNFAFDRTWTRRGHRFPKKLTREQRRGESFSPLVQLNITRRLRIKNNALLLSKISSAQSRIWIMNPYFVPTQGLVMALKESASRGVDVKLIGPSKSDVFFIPFVSSLFYFVLLKAGVKVFQYLPSILHAKTVIIDDWARIGSSNLNHRSFLHDQEVDVLLSSEESKQRLEDIFLTDLKECREIKEEDWNRLGFIERLLCRVALLFRYWM